MSDLILSKQKQKLMNLTLPITWDYTVVLWLFRLLDAHQLPLDLRHEELDLHYLMRIKSKTNNSSSKLFAR